MPAEPSPAACVEPRQSYSNLQTAPLRPGELRNIYPDVPDMRGTHENKFVSFRQKIWGSRLT